MGKAHAEILLNNPRHPELREIAVLALADTGSDFLCLPPTVVMQLQLESNSTRQVVTADGRTQMCRYVGPVHVRFDNRECYVGALELGDEVLLGAIPMEDMDVLVHPKLKKLVVNPDYPNFGHGSAKGLNPI